MPKPKLSDAITKPDAAAEDVTPVTDSVVAEPDGSTAADETAEAENAEAEPDAAEAADAKPDASGESDAADTSKTLTDYMAAFGDADGARMFRDGASFEDASSQTIVTLRGEIHDLKAENTQLKQRVKDTVAASEEDEPLATGGDASNKVSFSEAARGKRTK